MRYIFYFTLLMGLASHYSSSTPTALSRTVSTTNIDSNYLAITGHVGVLGDSLADSLFIPVYGMGLPGGLTAGNMDINIHTSDTLTDSVFAYSNHVFLSKMKIYKGNNDFFFGLSFGPNANQGISDLYELKFKMKQIAGKAAHVIRVTPNYILQ